MERRKIKNSMKRSPIKQNYLHKPFVSSARFLMRDASVIFPFRISIFVAFLVLGAVFETLATASLAPVLQAIGVGTETGSAGNATRFISNILQLNNFPTSLWTLSLIFLCLTIGSQSLTLAQTYLASRLNSEYAEIWQMRQVSALLAANWLFHIRSRGSDAVNLIVNETNRVAGAFYHLALIVSATITLVIYLTVSMLISWKATLTILFAGTAILLVTRFFLRRAYKLGEKLTQSFSELQSDCSEIISAIRLIKMTGTEDRAENLLRQTINVFKTLVFRSSFEGQLVRVVFECFGAVMIFALLVLSPALKLDPATTLVILALFVRLYPRFTSLQQSLHSFNVASPALSNVIGVLQSAEFAKETRHSARSLLNTDIGADIKVTNLCVAINDNVILDGIDFHVEPGKVVGIAGGSGAGKTTLLDCFVGLIDPLGGEVLVDGIPIKNVSLTLWRHQVGYMGQDMFIFNATIKQNLTWMKPDASDEEIEAATKSAAIHDFIMSQPLGYETIIGERGLRLSGGEKQRLSLARVFLQKPRLLILDEATSALDAMNEASVMSSIQKMKGKCTIFVIAHRLVSLMKTDVIYFIKSGKIIEHGTWDELTEQDTVFSHYWAMQKGAD